MSLYHISKGTSQTNFVQNLVLLTKFEQFLLKTAGQLLMMLQYLLQNALLSSML